MMDRASQISKALLELQLSIAPTVAEMDQLENELRDIVAAGGGVGFTREVKGLGTVKTSAAVERKQTGTREVLVQSAWHQLKPRMQAQLRKLGVVITENMFSNARKVSVTVKLDPTALVEAVKQAA